MSNNQLEQCLQNMIVDLVEMANFRRAVDDFIKKQDCFDQQCKNSNLGKTKYGFDKMFRVNDLGQAYCKFFLSLMRKTSENSPVTIIIISAAMGKKT